MLTPNRILHVILWSLGIAAAAGVLSVLFGSYDVLGRVCGTAFLIAAATGLLWPVNALLDREKTRAIGTVGLVTIVADVLLIGAAIWVPTAWLYDWFYWACWLSALILALSAPVLMLFMRFLRDPSTRLAGIVGSVLTSMTAGLFLAPLWMEVLDLIDWWLEGERLLGSGLATGLIGVPAVASLIVVRHSTAWFVLRWVGVGCAAVALTMAMVSIWGKPSGGEAIFTFFCVLTAVIGHANLCLLAPLRPGQVWLRRATIAAAVVTGVCVVSLTSPFASTLLERLAAAAAILTSCGSLALVIMARLNRPKDWEATSELPAQVTLFCPRCRGKHTVPTGTSSCPTCQLRIRIELEEPRCRKCGYLLYMLTSDTCPECGELIALSSRAPSSPPSPQPT